MDLHNVKSLPIYVTFGLAFILSIGGLCNMAEAQTKPATQSTPDWTGQYRGLRGKELELFPPLNMGKPVVLPPKMSPVDYLTETIVARLQPWAKLKMEASRDDAGIIDDLGAICQLEGPFRWVPNANGLDFILLRGKDRMIIIPGEMEGGTGVWRIYMDQKHPQNLRPTFNGHSVGRWEGDTLIVDTIGYNDKTWLNSNMEPHTEELHVVQRMWMAGKIEDDPVMGIEWTFDDRKAFTSAFSITRFYRRDTRPRGERVCNDDPKVWKELNGKGAQHSDSLHLVERIRPLTGGRYLEYRVTAEDPKTLAKPYTYTRYYQKTKQEILDYLCEDEE